MSNAGRTEHLPSFHGPAGSRSRRMSHAADRARRRHDLLELATRVMTSSSSWSSVSPAFSSKVAVVTAPSSPPSSLVQTRRECGVTSMYLPKNAISEPLWLNTSRYVPPTRTSSSQESRVRPNDFGTHHRLNSSGLVKASNTMRAGPLMVRVTTVSRSDFRSTVVGFFVTVGSVSLLASIGSLLSFQFL